MKTIRIMLAIIFFIPSYPILFATYSLFGIGLMMGFVVGMSIIFAWLSGNREWIDNCKEGWIVASLGFWIPFAIWYHYIKTGNFKESDYGTD